MTGVKAASHVRADKALVDGEETDVSGHRPGHDRPLLPVRVDEGVRPDARAARRRRRARHEGLRRGPPPRGRRAAARSSRRRARSARSSCAASTTRRRCGQLLYGVSIAQATFDDAFPSPKNAFTFLDADAGAGAALDGRGEGLGRRHAAHRRRRTRRTPRRTWRRSWRCSTCCSGFSVVVSLFGMVNTLVLSVFERTRELGMLRAIGMTRRQARRMIRHESVITALIGAALGLGLGVFLAALVDPGAVGVRRRAVAPGRRRWRVHARRGARRHRRGDPPRPPGVAAERARRPPLRVGERPPPRRCARRGGGRPATRPAGRRSTRVPRARARRPRAASPAGRRRRSPAAGSRSPARRRRSMSHAVEVSGGVSSREIGWSPKPATATSPGIDSPSSRARGVDAVGDRVRQAQHGGRAIGAAEQLERERARAVERVRAGDHAAVDPERGSPRRRPRARPGGRVTSRPPTRAR